MIERCQRLLLATTRTEGYQHLIDAGLDIENNAGSGFMWGKFKQDIKTEFIFASILNSHVRIAL